MSGFERWWPIVLSAVRDVVALGAGVWILLFKQNASGPLLVIGFLLLTLSASGAAKAFLQAFGKGNS